MIEKYQRDAAERLQLDWSLASCIPTAKAGTARGNYSDFGMAQAITDARRRHGDAVRLWQEPERGFMEAIVLHNLGLINARRTFGIAKHKASETFRDCLSTLADHYDRQSCERREHSL